MSHVEKNVLGMIFIALYVDDCLCMGDQDAIKSLDKEFVNAGSQVNPTEELNNYLSCKININNE